MRDDGLIARDVFNLEQIEVFSGPTGSDVGRTNAAGYINLATKTPNLEGAQAGTLSSAPAKQLRATVDINQPVRFGNAGTFLGNAAIRVNALWQDGGVRRPRLHASARASRSRRRSPSASTRRPAPACRRRSCGRTTSPTTACRPRRSPIGPLAGTSVLGAAAGRSGELLRQPRLRLRQGRAGQRHAARSSTTSRRTLTLRNQTRYNATTREAVITSIANPAAYNPETNLVTLSRQANTRENEIFSNQTNLSARVTTGGLRHEISAGLEIATESQFAPTLTGVGTRAPIDINHPDVFSPVVGMNIVPTGASSDGSTDTVALYVFDAFDLGPRFRVNGGVRVERYETKSRSMSTAGVPTDIAGDGTLVSGKAGLVFRLNDQGNLYVSYGSSLTPPGSANFQLNAGATNQNNPNVDPQESVNYEVGSKWDLAGPPAADRRRLLDREQERHLRRRRHGNPADLQPGRRPERQGHDRVAHRPDHAVVGRDDERAVPRLRGQEPEPRDQRQAPRARARVLGQPVDDGAAAARHSPRRRAALYRRRVHQHGEHDGHSRLHRSPTRSPRFPSGRSCWCG